MLTVLSDFTQSIRATYAQNLCWCLFPLNMCPHFPLKFITLWQNSQCSFTTAQSPNSAIYLPTFPLGTECHHFLTAAIYPICDHICHSSLVVSTGQTEWLMFSPSSRFSLWNVTNTIRSSLDCCTKPSCTLGRWWNGCQIPERLFL